MHKTFVIDTSVLIYDPSSLTKFKDNEVIIPLIVLEELNSFKHSTDELGKHARQVLRYIDSIKKMGSQDFVKGIKIPEGPTIKIHLQDRYDKSFSMSLDKNSNKIIYIAFILQKDGANVTFVSKDLASRVKAEALGIVSEDYESLKVQYNRLYRGIIKIDKTQSDVDLFHKKGFLETEEKLFSNEYCIINDPSTIGKYNAKMKRIEPISHEEKDLWGIHPLNAEQRCAIDLLFNDKVKLITLVGPAGTGKTLLALASGMSKVFHESVYSKILISRPIVPLGKDIGYLPGTKEEKLYHWMQPIYDNLEFLCTSSGSNAKNTLEWILESKKIEMEAVTYIRGRSLPHIFMIIDEAQNLTPHEVKTIISRAGKGTKVILTGDPTQIDNPYLDQDSNGLTYTVSKFHGQEIFGHIFLDKTERSPLASIATEVM